MESTKSITNNVTGISPPAMSRNEIELQELLGAVYKKIFFILSFSLMSGSLAFIYALNQPNIYQAKVILSPTEQETGGGLSSLTGQLGGLASLAGVNLKTSSNNTKLALEVIKSRQFLGTFIERHDILPELMAAKSWNMATNTLTFDEQKYNPESKKWLREVSAPFTSKPSIQEAYKVFRKSLKINIDENADTITISFEHISPYIAQQWVSWIVDDINLTMKQMEVSEAERSTAFLKEQLSKTEVTALREILYRLIEEQTKTVMFANVRDEYVLKTIDKALVPEEKIKPNRAIIIIAGTIFGLVFSVSIVLIRYFSSNES